MSPTPNVPTQERIAGIKYSWEQAQLPHVEPHEDSWEAECPRCRAEHRLSTCADAFIRDLLDALDAQQEPIGERDNGYGCACAWDYEHSKQLAECDHHKRQRDRADAAERQLAEMGAILETVQMAVEGQPVSDFMESFPIVRAATDMRAQMAEQAQELVRLRAQTTWQPIATAPKDEVRVLLFNPDKEFGSWRFQTGAHYEQLGGWQYDGQKPAYSNAHPPTHWQPLPSAPPSADREADHD